MDGEENLGPADYPHIIQGYRSVAAGQISVTTTPAMLMNVTNAIPHFARHCALRSDHSDELLVRDGGLWWRKDFPTDRKAIHSLIVDCGVDGAQAVDLMVDYSLENEKNIRNESSNQAEKYRVKHRRRRHHRKVRGAAATLYFAAPSYTAVVLEEFPPPVYVVHMNVSSSARAVRFSMTALMDSRSQAMFAMDAETGVVTTEVQLDREAIAQVGFNILIFEMKKSQFARALEKKTYLRKDFKRTPWEYFSLRNWRPLPAFLKKFQLEDFSLKEF